jgi:hypothetical protein
VLDNSFFAAALLPPAGLGGISIIDGFGKVSFV